MLKPVRRPPIEPITSEGSEFLGLQLPAVARILLTAPVPFEQQQSHACIPARGLFNLIEHREYVRRHGKDMPALADWSWPI